MKKIQKLIGVVLLVSVLFAFNTKTSNKEVTYIFVASNGVAENSGTIESPVDFNTAIEKVKSIVKEGKLAGGVTIYLRGGRYSFNGAYNLGSSFSGTEASRIVISAYNEEKVLFDGGRSITGEGFEKVKGSKELKKLAKSAKNKILVKQVDDELMARDLGFNVVQALTIDGQNYLPSVYPNTGYATLDYKEKVLEVAPPAIPHGKHGRAGNPPFQEPGKSQGWKGTIEEPRGAQVGFDKREKEMAGTWKQWAKEINGNNKRNQLVGFLDADWLQGAQGIYAANSRKKTIHLSRALAYGWEHMKEKDFKVYGLLCELDTPGEWHFDPKTKKLYIYPENTITDSTRIGIPFSFGFINFNGADYVSIIGISVENVARGSIFRMRRGSDNNLIAGCKFLRSTACGVEVSGKNNRIVSSDFTDLNFHLIAAGGVRAPNKIESANNLVENCHFYQKDFDYARINILIKGVGNTFRKNLVHNSLGQAIMVKGNDHTLELNEFFNIGYEEGDGGAVYSGADLAGYGNMYRHNFFHHLMHVPGKITRAGIHLDDLQAGATCIGNIFYKSASKGIFMNAGSGHILRHNVNLEGDLGIYNVGKGARKFYEKQEEILKDPNHDNKNTKENYVGNAERTIGLEGWNNDIWKIKYPRMHMIMNDTGEFGRMWPIGNIVEDNYAYGNSRGDKTVWDRFDPEATAKSIIKGDKIISPDVFENYDVLDLRFKKDILGMPVIPFENIGLEVDEYRKVIPNKAYYRKVLKDFFDGIKSFSGTKKKINTAKLIEEALLVK